MNKQDCLLQLGEAAREINGYRNAAHLMELQVEGYCNRIKELKARDAQQSKEIMEVIKRLEFVNGKFEKDAVDLGYAIESLKALLLVEEEA